MPTNNHGGRRPNQTGRPLTHPERRQSITIRITPTVRRNLAQTAGDRGNRLGNTISEVIENAIRRTRAFRQRNKDQQ